VAPDICEVAGNSFGSQQTPNGGQGKSPPVAQIRQTWNERRKPGGPQRRGCFRLPLFDPRRYPPVLIRGRAWIVQSSGFAGSAMTVIDGLSQVRLGDIHPAIALHCGRNNIKMAAHSR
jgi:hypothetical protein